MSHKKKKKLDKKLIQEKLRELETQTGSTETRPAPPPQAPLPQKAQTMPQDKKETPAPLPTNPVEENIRHDVTKISIVMGVIMVLFVVLYLVNSKTNCLISAGDWIFKILHVGQI